MKKTLLALAAASLSFSTLANTYLEVDFTHISESNVVSGEDFSQPALTGIVGYNFNSYEDDFQNKVEAFLGFGLSDDTVAGVDLNMKHYYGISYRPTMKLNDDWDIFARLSLAKMKGEADSRFGSASTTSDTETGYGLGISYKSFNLSYDRVEDVNFISAGYTFKF